ncbi:PcfB family protein [Gemmiger formicilis]|nr:PcfB family protein [Gemmiger formicilis]
MDKDRMHDFARAAKSHGLLFCPIRDKMDPDHIEIAILQDDASKANRIIEKLQLDVVDTGMAEIIEDAKQKFGEPAPKPSASRPRTVRWILRSAQTRNSSTWVFRRARRTPVRPSLSPTAANLLQTRRRLAPISFGPRVNAPACAWNSATSPPICAERSSRRKTVCRRCP